MRLNKFSFLTLTTVLSLAVNGLPGSATVDGKLIGFWLGKAQKGNIGQATTFNFTKDSLILHHIGEPKSEDKTITITTNGTTIENAVNHAAVFKYAFTAPDEMVLDDGTSLICCFAVTDRQYDVLCNDPERARGALWNPQFSQIAQKYQASTNKSAHTAPVQTVAFSPNGKMIASGGDDETVKLWNAKTGTIISTLVCAQPVDTLDFSPDGKMIAAAGEHKKIALIDAESGKLVDTLVEQQDSWRKEDGSFDGIDSIKFTADGKSLAAGGNDAAIRIWNVAQKSIQRTLTGHTDDVYCLAFSPDGRTLVSGGSGTSGTIRFWNMQTGANFRKLDTDSPMAIVFSPDGKTLASGGSDNQYLIKLWNPENGKQTGSIRGHAFSIHALAFSPDGKILASGSDDKTIKLWNLGTRQLLRTLEGHTEGIHEIAFSPDGKSLVSCSDDKTVRLWDVATGKQLLIFGH